MNSYTTRHDTLDFRPAPAGWTVYYFDDSPGVHTAPLAGWEIQSQTRYLRDTWRADDEQPPLTERPRRIVPVDMDSDGLVSEPADCSNFWMITGPGEPSPTADQIETAWRTWRAEQVNR